MNICIKFEEPIDRFGLYIIKLEVTVTLTFDRLISESIGIIYTPKTNVCAEFDKLRSILCLVIMQTRFGFYINIMTVTVTLTFDTLTSKSIGITYILTCISVPNLMNLGQFVSSYLDKVWSIYNMLTITVTLTFDRLI